MLKVGLKVVVMNIDDPGRLADLIATNLDLEVREKQEILEVQLHS